MDINHPIEPASLLPGRFQSLEFQTQTWAPGTIASVEDYAACRAIMHSASKNYSFASRFLPQDRLPYVEALYALMRLGDDLVDVDHSAYRSPQDAIDAYENAYWHAFHTGDSPDPVLRAYLDTAHRFAIPAATMLPYFRAMRDDLTISRYPAFADLLHYMEGSALPVGRAMTHILGVCPPCTLAEALPGADSLSVAMQLSNFWRDIGEDWRRGRIYVPQEDMERFGYGEADLAEGRVDDRLIQMLEFQFSRTEDYYREARRAVGMLCEGRLGVMSALEIYHAILDGIRSNHYDVFTRRAGASKLRKLWLVGKAYWQVG
jgi:phytoene synthase